MDRTLENKQSQDEDIKELNNEIDVLKNELLLALQNSYHKNEDITTLTQGLTKINNKLKQIEKSNLESRKKQQKNYRFELEGDIKKTQNEIKDLRLELHNHLMIDSNAQNTEEYFHKLFSLSRKITRKSKALTKLETDLSNL